MTNAHALARYAALCQAGADRTDRRAGSADGRRSFIDRCFEVDRIRAEGNIPGALLPARTARRHDAEAEHGDQPARRARSKSRERAGSRREDREAAQSLRARRGARHRVPLGRPVGRGSHRASRRDEQDRQPALEADLLLWPRLAGGAAEGLERKGSECRCRTGRLRASREDERPRQQGRMEVRSSRRRLNAFLAVF
jgi:hypothetical protein